MTVRDPREPECSDGCSVNLRQVVGAVHDQSTTTDISAIEHRVLERPGAKAVATEKNRGRTKGHERVVAEVEHSGHQPAVPRLRRTGKDERVGRHLS